METIQENREICANCGGMCCKKCGCDFGADNFENLIIDYLQKKLEEGYISIVSYGNTFTAQLKMDVEKLFYDILVSNFAGVSKIELLDIINMLPLLEKAYPEEFIKAQNRANKSQQFVKKMNIM